MTVLLLCAAARSAGAQAPSAEALYEAGALRAAADSFAARAAADPGVAAHWYNLGATLYRAGADGKAIVAWTIAARVAPRDPVIRRARRLLPPPDPASEGLLIVGWATPGEWGLLAGAAWVALWALVLARARSASASRGTLALLGVLAAVAVVALGAGLRESRRRAAAVAVVVAPEALIRAAPYGAASAPAGVRAGGALLTGRVYGRWIAVSRADGVRGWVLATDIVPL